MLAYVFWDLLGIASRTRVDARPVDVLSLRGLSAACGAVASALRAPDDPVWFCLLVRLRRPSALAHRIPDATLEPDTRRERTFLTLE